MNKTLIIICLFLVTAGCKVVTIKPVDMIRIEAQSLERNPSLSRYADPWMYVGSDDEFDYVLYSGVIGEQNIYRVQKGQLRLEKRFVRTEDKSSWVPITTDGSTSKRNAIEIMKP